MRLRCRIGSHRWPTSDHAYDIPASFIEPYAMEGTIRVVMCPDCGAMKYLVVAMHRP